MELHELITAARGEGPVDLVLRGGTLVNVFTAEMVETDVAVQDGRVVGLGPGYQGREEIDVGGRILCPGLIDGHMHVESSMITVPELVRAVVPRGTTAAVLDPHELANVYGLAGIRYVLASRRGVPMSVFVMASSAVPATHMETSGARLEAGDLAPLFRESGVLGLAEMMNFPGVVSGDPGVLAKLRAAHAADVEVDGHCPGLSGRPLNAYVAAGIDSDHECTTVEEAREKLRLGMYLMIREASNARNLAALLPVVTPRNSRRCLLVTDDRHPADLLEQGHIDHLIRKAIRLGLDPITAVQMATINAAERFGLDRAGYGAIAPGSRADIVVVDDLRALTISQVFVDGKLVARDGRLVNTQALPAPPAMPPSIHINWERFPGFAIKAEGSRVKVIETVPGQIVTRRSAADVRSEDGLVVADPERDLLKLAVVERHHGTGNVGLGFVRGFGLKRGAIASSVAHDSHNVIIAGTDDDDMLAALKAIAAMDGGQVAVADGEVLARLPLPIGGLMSDRPVEAVRDMVDQLHAAFARLGGTLEAPFMALSFLALPVIPTLKLTDKGLVDVERFELVPLWADDDS
ncbi:MAG: adenine deaminase [Ardenticatenaceae bacterium]|nr:adenine deaminase [Ardenticatenaceae bacterium]